MAHMAGSLAKYGIYMHPNGTIKIDGDALSIAFAHTTTGTGMKPPEIISISIRDRAWPYINQIKTIKRLCEINGITCEPIGETLKI